MSGIQHRETIDKLQDFTFQLQYMCIQNTISWKVLLH